MVNKVQHLLILISETLQNNPFHLIFLLTHLCLEISLTCVVWTGPVILLKITLKLSINWKKYLKGGCEFVSDLHFCLEFVLKIAFVSEINQNSQVVLAAPERDLVSRWFSVIPQYHPPMITGYSLFIRRKSNDKENSNFQQVLVCFNPLMLTAAKISLTNLIKSLRQKQS